MSAWMRCAHILFYAGKAGEALCADYNRFVAAGDTLNSYLFPHISYLHSKSRETK